MKLTEAVGALRERRFVWYFAARTTTSIGSAMTSVALAFAVLHISDDPGALAQVLAAHMAAMVIFLLLGGVVADRYSRTVIMQTSHALTFLTQGMAAYLVLTGTAQIWHLVALEAVNGAVSAFGMPAMMGVVPLVVGPDRIQQANALLSFSRSSITIVGPALAGALVVGAGPGWALLVDSALFLVAIPMLRQVALPGRDRNVTASPSVIAELREGWGSSRRAPGCGSSSSHSECLTLCTWGRSPCSARSSRKPRRWASRAGASRYRQRPPGPSS